MTKTSNASSRKYNNYHKQWALAVGLFFLALAVRLPELDRFLTFDEPVWLLRSTWFMTGLLSDDSVCPPDRDGRRYEATGLVCTLQPSYPGVTTMWGGVLGLLFHYWQQDASLAAETDFLSFLEVSRTFSNADTGLIASVRLTGVFIDAAFVAIFFSLVRRLLSGRVAVIAALLVALSPFQVALARVLHTDALLTTFMLVSVLSMVGYWLQGWSRRWLIVSGISAGLALLTKPVGWFLIPNLLMLVGFSLLYYRSSGRWSGWSQIRRLGQDGLLWGLLAGLTVFVLFPALWVIPLEVITTSLFEATDLASLGHSHYFLGAPTQDPGPLYYPLGWMLQSSPLEVVGAIALGGVVLYRLWRQPPGRLRRLLARRPVELALLLYVIALVAFETVSPKKMVRYLLPAFPVIDIFVAYGLVWLWDRLVVTLSNTYVRRYASYALPGLVIGVQSWLLATSYPYYFTYFNPLFGGAATTARIMDISWGEGLDQAAAYLNQQPQAEGLTVTVCRGESMFAPFFVGNEVLPCAKVEQIMAADYIVYYLWNRMIAEEAYYWPYFRDHQLPEHRVTFAGVDYALVYRNPARYQTSPIDNRLEEILAVYGFDLSPDGVLRLYWHNVGLAHRQLMIGLVSPADKQAYWIACEPAPGFPTAPFPPDSIIESLCPLTTAEASAANLYDLQLAVGDATGIDPIESSGLAFVRLTPDRAELLQPEVALKEIVSRKLPEQATPLDVTYGDRMRLVGYEIAPDEITLYWQPIRRPDAGLAQVFQLEFQPLNDSESDEPSPIIHPIFSRPLNPAETPRGAIVPMTYKWTASITSNTIDRLKICLKIAGAGQIVPAVVGETNEPVECVSFAIQKGAL